MRSPSPFATLAAALAAWSCATGTSPTDVGFVDGDPDAGDALDSGVASNDAAPPNRYAGDGGTRPEGGARDSGSSDGASNDAARDSGGGDSGPPDSGTVRTDLCQGTTSQQVVDFFGNVPYDDLCDAYYTNTGGQGKPCAASGASCATFTGTDGYNQYCCFVPPQTGSYCRIDYGGTPQCLPK